MFQEANLLVLVTAAVLAHLTWRLLRNYVLPSPFPTLAGPPSDSFLFGNMRQMSRRDAWVFWKNLIETYGPVAKLHGFFGASALHIYDPKALHYILVKDQDKFHKGEIAHAFGNLIIGPGLLFTEGERHKKQRKMLNPVFSGAHMRNLTPVFHKITTKLQEAIRRRITDGPKEIDVLEWMGRTALELVGQGGLGHSFDPLTADSQDEFTEAIKSFSASLSDIGYLRAFLPFIIKLGPGWFRRIMLDALPSKKVQFVKYITDTAHAGCRKIFEEKKAALKSGDQEALLKVGEGKDIMSVLLKANVMASDADRLPEDELMAQMTTFVVAGVDTTSNAISRVLHIISEKQDVQAKIRAEVREAREQYGEEIPYDEIMTLPYLDAVCRETLRLYAPVNAVFRQAMEDTVLPLHDPIRGTDGNSINEVIVPKGTQVVCSLRACNTNKAVWGEDAGEWKPERWLAPLPSAVDEARIPGIYSNLMTFISGSHSCIGFKFSQLEMKVVLAMLLTNFKFERSETSIVWNFAGIAFPAKSHDSVHPEMYLKVSVAE